MKIDYIRIIIDRQILEVYSKNNLIKTYAISTASKGTGQKYGSFQTPLGKHKIYEKIGDGEPINSVFIARKPTGEIYTPELEQQNPERTDWIITRILWLEGTETGFNRDGDVDSKDRKIYIHGTPDTRPMGSPFSHGCITLHNGPMLELFDSVDAGTPVDIIDKIK